VLGREPQVSVCVPTYNRAHFLREAMQSVLSQSFEDFELIVHDNASEDDTGSVVKSFSDERIRYFRNPRNLGHRENWSRCLRVARGNYIATLPDDDLMLPENLAKKVEVLLGNPQVGLVHSKYHLIDEEGRIMKYDTNWGHGPDRTVDAMERRDDLLTAFLNTINLPTVLFRRACYERLGGFSDRIELAYDWEYWMRIAIYYDVAFMAQPLVKWRIHSSSVTRTCVRNPIVQLREDLAAKRELFKHHVRAILGGRQLKRQMWRNMAERIFRDAQTMLEDGWGDAEARTFVLKMCLSFPGMLYETSLWKILLNSMLGRPVADLLRRKRSL
jgi:glycosyltransferase involved in cell wall biosynthesis